MESIAEQVLEILENNDIDPNKMVSGQTALEFLEGSISGALDEIEGH